MIKFFRNLILTGVLFAIPLYSPATEGDIKNYPAPGLFLANTVRSKEFKELSKEKLRLFFIPEFIKTFNANFDNTVKEISPKNKYKTLVGYISIPRASTYENKKPEGTIYELPLTVCLGFVNILTGETIYSTSETVYGNTSENNPNIIKSKFEASYKKALSSVINKAKNNYNPQETSVKIIDKYKNVYVLNKGQEAGIGENDLLYDTEDNELSVIYSTLNYSVAKSTFGDNLKMGSTFVKYSNNGGITQIKKPKVLLINDFMNETRYDLLVTSLGEGSKISIITANPTFNKVRTSVVDMNKLYSRDITPKPLPDYYFMFTFSLPADKKIRQNKSGLDSISYEMLVCGTMFDKAGKTVFSQCAYDSTEPRFSNEIYNTSGENVIEVLSKNLVEKISQKINEQIEFKEFEFKIKKIDDYEIVLDNSSNILSDGNSITLYKKVKTDKGIDYLVPTFRYNVAYTVKGEAICKMDFAYIDELDKPSKLNIAKSSLIVSSGGSNFYNVDTSNLEIEGNEIKLDKIDRFILPALAVNFKKPLSLDFTTIEKKADFINRTNMFSKKFEIKENNSTFTVLPSYSINLKKHKVQGYTKIDTYNITVNLKLLDKDKVTAQKSLKKEVTLVLPLKGEERAMKIELLNAVISELQEITKSIK